MYKTRRIIIILDYCIGLHNVKDTPFTDDEKDGKLYTFYGQTDRPTFELNIIFLFVE